MSKKSMTEEFFEALATGDEDGAYATLRSAAFDGSGAPTPRTQEYVKLGEWDTRDKLGIVFAKEGTCFGRVGTATQHPGGIPRFCGRSQCPTASHKRSTVDGKERRWYIQGGLRSTSGFFLEPSLPSSADGGPIPEVLEGQSDETGLLEGIRLTLLGQWKFIFETCIDAREHTPSSEEFEDVYLDDPPTAPSGGRAATHRDDDAKPSVKSEELKGKRLDSDGESPDKEHKPNPSLLRKAKPTKAASQDTSVEAKPGIGDAEVAKLQEAFKVLLTKCAQLEKVCARSEATVHQLSTKLKDTETSTGSLEADMFGLQGRLTTIETIVSRMQTNGHSQQDHEDIEKLKREVLDPRGSVARLEHDIKDVATRMESGGGIEFHSFSFNSAQATVEWFDGHDGHVALFADAVALLHAINATVVHTPDSTKSKEAAKKIDLESELEAGIIASFSTTLPSIFVGNKKDTQGGAYECLIGYLKDYNVWSPMGAHSTSGLKHRIREGTKGVSTRLKTLQNVLTTRQELKEVAMYLISDSLAFVMELSEFVTQQFDDLKTTSSFTKEAAWSLIIDCIAQIFVELGEVRGAVVDAGQMQPGLFLWGMLRAWEVQERYRHNQFKNDPSLTGLLVRRILIHDGEQSLKDQLATVAVHEQSLKDLSTKVENEHKELVAFQKKVKTAVPAMK